MKLHNIAINNLRRRKAKVCFLVMGLLVGVASVVALLSITRSLAEDMVHKMDEFGANILIIPKSEGLSLNYGGIDLGGLSFDQKEISQEDLAKIKTIDNAANIRLVSPKVLDVFELNGQKALAVGVDFPSELALKKWWVINGTTPKSDSELILGREAAVKLGANVGSRLDIKGSEFWVSGVLDTTGSQDDSLVFMTLPVSQKIFKKEGKVSMVEIAALCKNCPISDIVTQISGIIPTGKVTAVQQVVAGRMDALNHFQKFSLGISGLVLLVGAMVVFVTMMGSVNERTREIGIFSAIGFRSSHIMKIILLEAFVVSFSAGLLGYLLGIGVTYGTLRALSDHAPNLTIDYTMAVGSIFLAVLVGLLASFYPARSAAAMDPSEALRTL
ncbi:MAG: ABC transporter permease [Syntrophaceae bacterium]|nr:ABC transporter permease [Syntrophaceae bacterium]